MSLKSISEGSNFELPEPGLYPCVVTGVIDVGAQSGPFGVKHKVYVMLELIGTAMSDGRPFVLSRPFTPTLHKQGNLLPFLESLRGRSFTSEERKNFDLTRIAGQSGRVVVQHSTSESGRVYANIANMLPPEKSQPTTAMNPVLVYDTEEPDPVVYAQLPEWLQQQIDGRVISAKKPEPPTPKSADPAAPFDDDLAF